MKSVSEKKSRGHRTLFILELSARSMDDVACEFACAVRMRRNN